MSLKALISKGNLYIFFYIITCAFSNVFINHTTRSIDPIVSLFYTSIFTIIFFSILNFGELTKNITLVKKNMNSILWLNLLNAIIWFVIFFCLKVLSPAVFSCLFLGAIPINLFILGLRKSTTNKKSNFTIAFLLLTMFLLMLLLVSQEMSKTNYVQILKYGTIVVVIGGAVAAFIMKISKKLATENLSASLVVSLRFYGLLIISFLIIISKPTQMIIEPTVLVEFFALALISMALPLFLLQKALKTLSPLYTSIIITSIPILTYFLQLWTGYYLFSYAKLGVILLFCLCLIILTSLNKRHEIRRLKHDKKTAPNVI